MSLKMRDVFMTRHSVKMSEKVHGGQSRIIYLDNIDLDTNIDNVPLKQNPNELRRNSDFVNEQPTVNIYLDPKEAEWKINPRGNNSNEKDGKKPDGKSKDKTEEGEDPGFFCCS